jgi:hypothetical protein
LNGADIIPRHPFLVGRMPAEMSLEGLVPSLAARLDVALGEVDGHPVGWLAGKDP